MQPTTMYYFRYTDEDGENFDWFVEAKNIPEAIKLYVSHIVFDHDEDTLINEVDIKIVPLLSGKSEVKNWIHPEIGAIEWKAMWDAA